MKSFAKEKINQFILWKQHLRPESKSDDIFQVVEDLCGLQATGTFEPYLYLFSRLEDFKRESLNKELYENKNLIKIRGMRNTLFIVKVDDASIVHNATNFLKDNRFEGFFKHTDFTRDEYFDLEAKILHTLEKEPLIATDIKKRIESDRSISIILSLMCDKLLIVRDKPPKGWKDRRNTYALMKNSYTDLDFENFREKEAVNELVFKYIKSYGPVTEEDIAWWGGFTKTNTRNAVELIANKIEQMSVSNTTYYILKSDLDLLKKLEIPISPGINILANLDPYLMGYKNRNRFINSERYPYVFDRSGNATTTILKNGKVIGIWDFQDKPKPKVKFLLFKKVSKEILNKIKQNVKMMGEFLLEKEVNIQECKDPLPLTKRSAGTFMRPLKHC